MRDSLLERVLAQADMEAALTWKRVKANRGSGGAEGLSIAKTVISRRAHYLGYGSCCWTIYFTGSRSQRRPLSGVGCSVRCMADKITVFGALRVTDTVIVYQRQRCRPPLHGARGVQPRRASLVSARSFVPSMVIFHVGLDLQDGDA